MGYLVGLSPDADPMDDDLRSVQQARDLLRRAHHAQKRFAAFDRERVDDTVWEVAAPLGTSGREAGHRRGVPRTGEVARSAGTAAPREAPGASALPVAESDIDRLVKRFCT